jgi:predicted O-methyltransferase YrrM
MAEPDPLSVDRYLSELLVPTDTALDAALMASGQAGLPSINVAPNQGKMLELIARSMHARRVLEIGTLGGYSAIWLARALTDGGKLITLELDQSYAEVAVANIARAGVSDRVEVRVGPAAGSLQSMIDADEEPFDLIFIDADKATYPTYFELSLELSRPLTLIIADNVVRDGAVTNARTKDENVKGVRRFLEMIADDERVDATAVQTVGSKGWDGFAFALVR